jgi:hypothetical protein
MSPYLHAARLPWGLHIVYQKRRQAIAGNIAKLLRIRHVISTDINGIELRIIAKADRRNLWLTTLVHGCQSSQPLCL